MGNIQFPLFAIFNDGSRFWLNQVIPHEFTHVIQFNILYGGFWKLHEVKLWEGSFVTFGANSSTPNLSAVKSEEDRNEFLEDLNKRMETFRKAIKDGSYNKNYNSLFELELMQIQKSHNTGAVMQIAQTLQVHHHQHNKISRWWLFCLH